MVKAAPLAALSFVVLTIFLEIALVRLPARVDNRRGRGRVLGCWMLGEVGEVGVVVKEVDMVDVVELNMESRERCS